MNNNENDEFFVSSKTSNQENPEPQIKSTSIYRNLLIGILSVCLIIAIVLGISYLKTEQKINMAESLISQNKFEDGIAIYDELLIKNHSAELIAKKRAAVEIMESDINFNKGLKAFEEGNTDKAVKYMSKVSKMDTKRYKESLDKLEEFEEADSETISESKSKRNEKILYEKEKQQAKLSRQKTDEAINIASSLKGANKIIVAKGANLRSEPTVDASVVTTLNNGDQVYIHDTLIESSDRIWCSVTYNNGGDSYNGWVSYNTMNYDIQ